MIAVDLLGLVYGYVDELLKNPEAEKEELRRRLIERIVENYSRGRELDEKLRLSRERLESLAAGLALAGFHVFVVDAKLSTMGAVGVSHGVLRSVFEVGVSWDHVLDLPFIPGSSVKGAVRAVAERASRDDADVLFGRGGDSGWAGLLLFFDAYPVEAGDRLLEPDIVTPHYSRGGRPVRFEYEVEPVPVAHVSIAPGAVFRFVVAVEPGGGVLHEEVDRALANICGRLGVQGGGPASLLLGLLEYALASGVGARTSQGYGRFEVVSRSAVINGSEHRTPLRVKPARARRGRSTRPGAG